MQLTRSPHAVPPVLRREVGRLRARESRRVFDASVHLGELGSQGAGFVLRARDRPAMDAGLRIEVMLRLLEDTPQQWATAWLVRPGAPEPHDLDLQWLAAARTAFGIHDRELAGCYVITRTGWRDVLTDDTRVWTRLRLRPENP